MKIPFAVRVTFGVKRSFQKKYQANICGHTTMRKGLIHNDMETIVTEMPLASNGSPDYCLECIGNMSIQCAWCNRPIFVGDPITLYIPQKSFVVPPHAVRYTENDSQLVGCSSFDCASSGADVCGRWMPPGKVERVPSPLELCFQTGQIVIVSDMSNYPTSVTLHSITGN